MIRGRAQKQCYQCHTTIGILEAVSHPSCLQMTSAVPQNFPASLRGLIANLRPPLPTTPHVFCRLPSIKQPKKRAGAGAGAAVFDPTTAALWHPAQKEFFNKAVVLLQRQCWRPLEIVFTSTSTSTFISIFTSTVTSPRSHHLFAACLVTDF